MHFLDHPVPPRAVRRGCLLRPGARRGEPQDAAVHRPVQGDQPRVGEGGLAQGPQGEDQAGIYCHDETSAGNMKFVPGLLQSIRNAFFLICSRKGETGSRRSRRRGSTRTGSGAATTSAPLTRTKRVQ